MNFHICFIIPDSLNADKITEIKEKYTTSIWDNFNLEM